MSNIVAEAISYIESKARTTGKVLNSSKLGSDYCRLQLSGEDIEVFGVCFFDNKHKLIAFERMFTGTIAECPVYPREIARKLLELNANKVILTHNHPSGDTTPSKADIDITDKIKQALRLFDAEVVDHIIVSHESFFSFAEKGLI